MGAVLLPSLSLSQSSAKCRLIFLLFVKTFCSRLFAKFFDLRCLLSVSSPLRSVGTPSPLPRGSCSFKPGNNLEPCTDSLEPCRRVWHRRKSEQRKFGYQQTRPNGTLVVSSYSTYIRRLVTRPLFRSRARVALGSELRLLMSFSWPFFPGLDQVLFSPWFSWFWGFDSKTVQRSLHPTVSQQPALSSQQSPRTLLSTESDTAYVTGLGYDGTSSPSSPAGFDGSAVLQAGELPSSGVT